MRDIEELRAELRTLDRDPNLRSPAAFVGGYDLRCDVSQYSEDGEAVIGTELEVSDPPLYDGGGGRVVRGVLQLVVVASSGRGLVALPSGVLVDVAWDGAVALDEANPCASVALVETASLRGRVAEPDGGAFVPELVDFTTVAGCGARVRPDREGRFAIEVIAGADCALAVMRQSGGARSTGPSERVGATAPRSVDLALVAPALPAWEPEDAAMREWRDERARLIFGIMDVMREGGDLREWPK